MWVSILAALLLSVFISATPVPVPDPKPLSNNAADTFSDWPVDVILTASAAQFGMWVPTNGLWYSAGSLTCLNAGAGSYGSCAIPSFDHVGVVAGYGPCTIRGKNGFQTTLQGNTGEGFVAIAPPQQLSLVTCGKAGGNSTKR